MVNIPLTSYSPRTSFHKNGELDATRSQAVRTLPVMLCRELFLRTPLVMLRQTLISRDASGNISQEICCVQYKMIKFITVLQHNSPSI